MNCGARSTLLLLIKFTLRGVNEKTSILLVALFLLHRFYVIAFPAQAKKTLATRAILRPIIHDYCLNCHEPGGKGYEASGLDMTYLQEL